MEQTIKAISPRSVPGSFALAVFSHAAIFGGVLLFLKLGVFQNHEETPAPAEEIAYETFSAPPAPTQVVKPVAKTPEPDTPDEPEDQTPDTTPKELQDSSSTIAGTQAAPKQQVTTGAQGVGDAATTPFYKIKPKYPRAALVAGTEGWVILKVDIKEDGGVDNVRVVGGQQRNLFQDEARRAVEKWKYKPFLDANGKPIKKTDHEIRVDFKLQDAAV